MTPKAKLLTVVGLCSTAIALLTPHQARAQGTTEQDALVAEAEFAAGVTLMKGGQCASALDRFRESQRLDPASGTLLDIAYCEEQLGHLARAFTAYRQAVPLATDSHKPEHARVANEGVVRLTPLLGWLWLRLSAPAERWRVTIDGVPWDAEASSLVPLDAGEHLVSAKLNGQSVPSQTTRVSANERVALEFSDPVSVAPPAPGPVSLSSTAVVHDSGAASGSTTSQPPPRDTGRPHAESSDVAAWAFTGSGSALLAGSVGLFLYARISYDNAECTNRICKDDEAEHTQTLAGKLAIASGIGAGVGAALLGTGLVLFYTSSDDADAKLSASLTPWSLSLQGKF